MNLVKSGFGSTGKNVWTKKCRNRQPLPDSYWSLADITIHVFFQHVVGTDTVNGHVHVRTDSAYFEPRIGKKNCVCCKGFDILGLFIYWYTEIITVGYAGLHRPKACGSPSRCVCSFAVYERTDFWLIYYHLWGPNISLCSWNLVGLTGNNEIGCVIARKP